MPFPLLPMAARVQTDRGLIRTQAAPISHEAVRLHQGDCLMPSYEPHQQALAAWSWADAKWRWAQPIAESVCLTTLNTLMARDDGQPIGNHPAIPRH